MKYLGLNNRTYNFRFDKCKSATNCSKQHERARELIKDIYCLERVYEEVPIEGCGKIIYADFLIPQSKLIVEVHGQQHYEFNKFFHGTQEKYYKAKARDRKKTAWAELNEFVYIELDSKESDEQWKTKLSRF